MQKAKIARWAVNMALRFGARSAVDTALSAAVSAVPKSTQQTHTQVFNVKQPVTVYVRGGNCRVAVRREDTTKVTIQASMYRAFGLELAAEQDDVGVYIVARRKPVVGKLSRTDFTIIVPFESHLVFHLTPGDIVLQDVDGMMELPPMESSTSANL